MVLRAFHAVFGLETVRLRFFNVFGPRQDAKNPYSGVIALFITRALGPHCGTVKLDLFSDKAPGKADPLVVDPKLLQQIWQDFAPYRELK